MEGIPKECAGIKNTGRCRRLLDIHAIRAGNCAGGGKGEGSENRGKDMNRPDCDCTVTPVSIAHKHLLYWFTNLPESGLRSY